MRHPVERSPSTNPDACAPPAPANAPSWRAAQAAIAQTATTQREFAAWASSLASDAILDAYQALFEQRDDLVDPMWRQHTTVWRCILAGEAARGRVAHSHLLALGALARITRATLDAVDRAVLDELMDVVATRFHCSPASIRLNGRLLIASAVRLAELRMAGP